MNERILTLLIPAVFAAAPHATPQPPETAPPPAAIPLQDLSGTAWQLVEIASMDDSVYRPQQGGSYRLVFGVDGTISVTADCNRATGALSLWDPPRLQFAALAATLAQCEADSLADRYLRELGWVRSYVYQNEHLYLATMADGSIMNFAPASQAEASATVGSLSLLVDDADALRGIILSRLLEQYAAAAGITVHDAEIDAYLAGMDRALRADLGDDYDDGGSLSEEEQADIARMRQAMASAVIRQWKINKALYEEYGGRIIYQQLGPEPLDAYLAFLENAQASGEFTIFDAELRSEFWSFFRDDGRHDFMPPGSDDESRAFSRPPWESQE